MTSARKAYDPKTTLGAKIARSAFLVAGARQAVAELHAELEAYNDDNAGLAVAAGMTDASAAADLRSLYANGTAEMTGQVLHGYAQGDQTSTRQIADQLA